MVKPVPLPPKFSTDLPELDMIQGGKAKVELPRAISSVDPDQVVTMTLLNQEDLPSYLNVTLPSKENNLESIVI